VDKITVVCHKDHDKGYEDYVGKCLLCEVERLQKREWVGLTDDEIYDYADKFLYQHGSNFGIKSFGKAIEAKLKEKNT
jgi:hypothetical protein